MSSPSPQKWASEKVAECATILPIQIFHPDGWKLWEGCPPPFTREAFVDNYSRMITVHPSDQEPVR